MPSGSEDPIVQQEKIFDIMQKVEMRSKKTLRPLNIIGGAGGPIKPSQQMPRVGSGLNVGKRPSGAEAAGDVPQKKIKLKVS